MPFSRGQLIILTYHRVLSSEDALFPLTTSAATFERHAKALKRGFRVMKLVDAVASLSHGTLPSRAVSITFDDGYRDNYTVALPILERFALPATFFVATGYLDGGRMWNDTVIESIRACRQRNLDLREMGLGSLPVHTNLEKAAAITTLLARLKYLDQPGREESARRVAELAEAVLPQDLMMSSEQVSDLAQRGMEVGAHTISHPILSRIPPGEAEREITNSRRAIADLTGRPPVSFAYPNGMPGVDYDRRHVDMVREAGFGIAVSTALGPVLHGCDPLQLPRAGPWDRSGWKFSLRLLRWYFQRPAPVAA